MTIGIIGADDRAVALGRMLRRCGHNVCFSDPIDDRTSQSAAEALGDGAFATTPYQQAANCETLLLTVHWEDLEPALAALGSYKDGIVIDATRPPHMGDRSGAELLAQKLDNRHVVKAFVEPPELTNDFKVASDDPEARAKVEEIIENCGRHAIDAGPLIHAREMEHDAEAIRPTSR
ncbi:MAG TPA: NAD(P)-binding domain-containing protein [Candidatus Baltobacteraceae bacterium]|nr:NAD(P)-binding domain-containing protein [Candidatus Baltobacteraceae bacterium]